MVDCCDEDEQGGTHLGCLDGIVPSSLMQRRASFRACDINICSRLNQCLLLKKVFVFRGRGHYLYGFCWVVLSSYVKRIIMILALSFNIGASIDEYLESVWLLLHTTGKASPWRLWQSCARLQSVKDVRWRAHLFPRHSFQLPWESNTFNVGVALSEEVPFESQVSPSLILMHRVWPPH